jgi:hypothetical protein
MVDSFEPANVSLECFAPPAFEGCIIDAIQPIGARPHIVLEQAVPGTVIDGLRRPDRGKTEQALNDGSASRNRWAAA